MIVTVSVPSAAPLDVLLPSTATVAVLESAVAVGEENGGRRLGRRTGGGIGIHPAIAADLRVLAAISV